MFQKNSLLVLAEGSSTAAGLCTPGRTAVDFLIFFSFFKIFVSTVGYIYILYILGSGCRLWGTSPESVGLPPTCLRHTRDTFPFPLPLEHPCLHVILYMVDEHREYSSRNDPTPYTPLITGLTVPLGNAPQPFYSSGGCCTEPLLVASSESLCSRALASCLPTVRASALESTNHSEAAASACFSPLRRE